MGDDQMVLGVHRRLHGGRSVDDNNHILFSGGRGLLHVAETNDYSWYIGWQITGTPIGYALDEAIAETGIALAFGY